MRERSRTCGIVQDAFRTWLAKRVGARQVAVKMWISPTQSPSFLRPAPLPPPQQTLVMVGLGIEYGARRVFFGSSTQDVPASLLGSSIITSE